MNDGCRPIVKVIVGLLWHTSWRTAEDWYLMQLGKGNQNSVIILKISRLFSALNYRCSLFFTNNSYKICTAKPTPCKQSPNEHIEKLAFKTFFVNDWHSNWFSFILSECTKEYLDLKNSWFLEQAARSAGGCRNSKNI